MLTVKIAKFLSQAGIASRRKAEILVTRGLISVNGKTITDPAVRIDPAATVTYRNKTLSLAQNVYYVLNKPINYTSTTEDPHAKYFVTSLVPDNPKVWPVGRLDKFTSGLLILTNDGKLTQKLTHPSFSVEKEYDIKTNFPLTQNEIAAIRQGFRLEDGFIKPDRFEKLDEKNYRIVIHSGKKRIVRRLIEKTGKSVAQLKRTRIGSFVLKGLPFGKWRRLTEREVETLLRNPGR